MPIYEFRCLKCHEIFEIIFTSSDELKELKCTHCGAEDMERVLSAANYSPAPSGQGARTSVSAKSCGTGSCSTIEIPGRGD